LPAKASILYPQHFYTPGNVTRLTLGHTPVRHGQV
jgi:hypothetical protein